MINVDFSAWLWPRHFAPSGAVMPADGGVSAGDILGRLPGRAPERLYRGARRMERGFSHGCDVVIVEHGVVCELNPRFDLQRHSPAGFEFGYHGSGPSQLALALCADALNDDARALRLYQDFKRAFVAGVEGDTFEITAERVREIADEIEAQAARSA